MTSRNLRKEKEANELKWQEMINWRSRYPRHFSSGWKLAGEKFRIKLCLKSVKVCVNSSEAVCFMKYDVNSAFKANRLSSNDKSFSLKKQLLKIYKVAGISIVLVLPASIKSRRLGAPLLIICLPLRRPVIYEVIKCNEWRGEKSAKCLRNSYDNIDRSSGVDSGCYLVEF